jgi:hypothetical protein
MPRDNAQDGQGEHTEDSQKLLQLSGDLYGRVTKLIDYLEKDLFSKSSRGRKSKLRIRLAHELLYAYSIAGQILRNTPPVETLQGELAFRQLLDYLGKKVREQ